MAAKLGESAAARRRERARARGALSALRSKVRVDAHVLPGAAASAFDRFTDSVLTYAGEAGVNAENFDVLISDALWLRATADPRPQLLDGQRYVALALARDLDPIITELARWDEAHALVVIAALQERWLAMVANRRFNLDLRDVPIWLRAHEADKDRDEAVESCIRVDAPEEVRLERRLAQTGAQKRVFAATWTVADDPTEIVLKEFLREAEKLLLRERRPHPLSMNHPNVVETFLLDNQAVPPQTFLVERRIEVLTDRRTVLATSPDPLGGWSEAARMFVDVARALAFLAEHGLVHGDVKPDNIGVRDGRFILLDFGICRPAHEFDDGEQTGTLRTRAPEVLRGERHTSKADVWALGATVFNVLFGRFPLLGTGPDFAKPETPPHVSDTVKRSAFEDKLRRRIDREWESRMKPLRTFGHRGFRETLVAALMPTPADRPDPSLLLSDALRALPALVGSQEGPPFATRRELLALETFLADKRGQVGLMPTRKRLDLEQRLDMLDRALRAQRHYQRAVDKLAAVAAVERSDPLRTRTIEQTRHLERLEDVAKHFRTPEDQSDLDLLDAVRNQLGLAETPRHAQPKTLLEALSVAIQDAKETGSEARLIALEESVRKALS